MPEEIRPSRRIERGFVDTGRAGPQGLDALSKALGRFGDLLETGVNFAERQARREEEETVEALSSPLITDEEITEIEEAARFPLSKMRAQNRRGELVVQKGLAEIQDEVAKAPDVVEARRILRERQAALLEQHSDDAAVQAGIRERMARESRVLLADASKRRISDRLREEQLNVDEDLRLSLETGGAIGYVNTLIPTLTDEAMSAGDVDGMLTRSALVLENHWRAGDDDSPGENIFADETLEAIDTTLDNVPMSSSQRKNFTALRDKIESGEEAARRTKSESSTEIKTANHARAQQAILDWQEANPTVPPPEYMRRRFIETGPTAAQKRAAVEWMEKTIPPLGVVDTDVWQKGRTQLQSQVNIFLEKQILSDDFDPNDAITANDIISVYEAIGGGADPELRDDPAALRQLREKAIADAPRLALDRQEQRAAAKQATKVLYEERIPQIEHLQQAGELEAANRLRTKMQAQIREIESQVFQQQINTWMERRGYSPFDLVDVLE